jgi:hypothetical protein
MPKRPNSARHREGEHANGQSAAIKWLRENGPGGPLNRPHEDADQDKRSWLATLPPRLGVTKQATFKWTRVPAERVLKVAQITGLSPHFLRPDIYPRPVVGKLTAD